jgi:phosphate-selective porin OprO/OprP
VKHCTRIWLADAEWYEAAMRRAHAPLSPRLFTLCGPLAAWLCLVLACLPARAQTGTGAPGQAGGAEAGGGGAAEDQLPALEPLGKGFPEAPQPAPEEPAPPPPPPPQPPAAVAPAATAPVSGSVAVAPPGALAPDVAAAPASGVAPAAGPHDRRPVVVDFEAGRGFELRTADGDFALSLGAGLQVLYSAVLPYTGENRQYLELRRARLRFAGNLFGAHNRFFIQLALSPRDLGRSPVALNGVSAGTDAAGDPLTPETATDVITQSPLLDAWLHFDHLRDLNFRVGQFRVPFSRQRLMPFSGMHFADRSAANAEFGLGRDIGFMLTSPNLAGLDCLRYYAGLFIGEGRDSSSRTLGAGDRGFSYVARVELTPFGRFDDDYADVDFERRSAPSLSFGAAYALLLGDATSPQAADDLNMVYQTPGEEPIVDYNAHNVTVDAMFKLRGLSLQSAFHYRQVAPIAPARDGVGFMLDAGYLLPPVPLEILGAFSLTRTVGSDSNLVEHNELGTGLAYYFVEHFLKVQVDLFHLWAPDAFSRGDERIRLQVYAGF